MKLWHFIIIASVLFVVLIVIDVLYIDWPINYITLVMGCNQ